MHQVRRALDKGPEDLLVDAAYQAYESAGLQPEDVDAYWLGTMGSGSLGADPSQSRSRFSTSR